MCPNHFDRLLVREGAISLQHGIVRSPTQSTPACDGVNAPGKGGGLDLRKLQFRAPP